MDRETSPIANLSDTATSQVTDGLLGAIVRLLEGLDRRLALIGEGRPAGAAYLSVREAASRVGLSETTVRRAVKRGDLHAFNLGSGRRPTWRIKAADLEAWAGRAR